jgi:tRNA (guanine-N(7)-)-methyltransferase subunit TRM82
MNSASALHSFILPTPESESSPTIKSFETTYPILDYSPLPNSSDTYLLTLDTTFGPINLNQLTGQMPKPKPKDFEVTEEQKVEMEKCYRIVKVELDGSVGPHLNIAESELTMQIQDITPTHEISNTLNGIITNPTNQGTPSEISTATLSLYPDLSLFPRWPGFEEDDDLAGPAVEPTSAPALTTAGPSSEPGGGPKKEYTKEELSVMNLKHLGRLKAQGYPVDDYMRTKRRETKDRRFEAKRAKLEVGVEEGEEEE